MNKIELLAPAGDMERLKIAYLYGADACYIGGKDYSLRANASNFSLEDIKEAARFAHKLKRKLYVTVNILFHQEDLAGIFDYLKALAKAHVDAVIIADVYLIPIIKKHFKNLKIFLSTQDSTTNSEAIKFFLKQGVDRIVLARELSKEEIATIYNKTKAHLEVFLHGAMCTSFSGRCVLSNYFTNRDANRGGCAQVCRFLFDLDEKREIPFSIATKDLNLSACLKDLIEIGVGSLKIEGRMRSMYYLATVISSYRRLIDAYYNNTYTKDLVKKETKILMRVANRASSNQYFTHPATYRDQYYLNSRIEASNQDFLALVLDYDSKKQLLTVEQRNYFQKGDKVVIFGPDGMPDVTTSVEVIYNEEGQEQELANHPKQLLKIKISTKTKILPNSMMRVYF